MSADKPEVEAAVAGLEAGIFPSAFCHIVADRFVGDPDHCMAIHADGVGSKSAVALLAYRERGDPAVFRSLAQDSLVMNTDDLLCVGATGPYLVSNTIGRNKRLFDAAMLGHLIQGYTDLARRWRGFGMELLLCGGETADLGDLVRSVVIDSTVAVRMRRDAVVDAGGVRPGHVIVALASFGRAAYEDRYNSGMGTNGLTAARHLLLSPRYRDLAPDSFDPALGELAYTGRFLLSDALPGGDGMTVGEALLSPTRTYVPIVSRVLEEGRASVSGMFHNTGGGLTKCLKFGHNVRYVKDNPIAPPPLFRLLADHAGMPVRELAQVFNMGQRFEIVCEAGFAGRIIEIAAGFGVFGQVIGRVEANSSGTEVEIAILGETVSFARDVGPAG